MKQKNLWLVFANLGLFILMLFEMSFYLFNVEWYVQAFAYTCMVAFSFGSFITYLLKKDALTKSCFTLNIITFLVITFFTVLNLCGIFDDFSDMDKIKQIILDAGSWGYIIYMLFQIVNVIILPIPGAIFILVGVAIFGPLKTFILTYISTFIGCLLAFAIGKFLGQKAVIWCVGEEKTKKYKEVVGGKGSFLFFVMQILPLFPDDILCMVVGLTAMNLSTFCIIILFTKAIAIALVCFFGSGSLIPFSGWGIPVWIGLALLLLVGFILFCKFQTQIENWLKKVFKRNKKSEVKNEPTETLDTTSNEETETLDTHSNKESTENLETTENNTLSQELTE